MNNQPIGILDSGVGGLSIWKEIVKELPNEQTIYLADSKNCPYGDKAPEAIYSLAKRLVRFLLDKKVKIIVLACNTITVFCIDRLRVEFPDIPIVGTVPVVKTAAQSSKNKKIGILSTSATARSSYQKQLIKKFAKDCKVINIGTSKLVPYVERGEIESEKVIDVLKITLKKFSDNGVDSIAIGCSHFPFLRNAIEVIIGDKVKVFDSGEAIARQVRRVLTNSNNLSSSNNSLHMFYTTGNVDQFTKVAKKLVEEDFEDLINQFNTRYSNDINH